MSTYAEALRADGATEDEIKVLATDRAEKQYAKLTAEATKARENELAMEAKAREYFELTAAEVARTNSELALARANEAKARAIILAAKETGMADLAKAAGYEADPNQNPNPSHAVHDPSKVVSPEQLIAFARTQGDLITLSQDIASEHAVLFPGQRVNFTELRKEADARRISIEQAWRDKYKVDDARAAASAKAAADHDKQISDAAYAKARTELASQYGNPDLRPLASSNSPFTPRPQSGRTKQPWVTEDGRAQENVIDRSGERVSRVVTKVLAGDAHRLN